MNRSRTVIANGPCFPINETSQQTSLQSTKSASFTFGMMRRTKLKILIDALLVWKLPSIAGSWRLLRDLYFIPYFSVNLRKLKRSLMLKRTTDAVLHGSNRSDALMTVFEVAESRAPAKPQRRYRSLTPPVTAK